MGALPLIWREQGYSLLQIGALQALYLPWVLKALWAPLVDRASVSGQARFRFLLMAQVLVSLVCLALAGLPPGPQSAPTFVVILLLSIVSATADNAGDAVAIKLTPRHDSARVNGWREAAMLISAAFGAGAGYAIAMKFGWSVAVAFIAAFSASGVLATITIKQRILCFDGRSVHSTRFANSLFLTSFLRPGGWLMFAIIALASAANRITGANPRILLSDLGLPVEKLSVILGVLEPGAGVLGALAAGALSASLGVARVLPAAIALKAFVLLALAAALQLSLFDNIIVMLFLLMTVCFAAIVTCFGGLIMRWSRKGSEATDAASFFTAAALVWFIMQPLSGFLADTFEYEGLFLISGILVLPMSLCMPLLLRMTLLHETERSAGSGGAPRK